MDINKAIAKCTLTAYATRSANTAKAYEHGIAHFIESIRDSIQSHEEITTLTISEFIDFPSWLAMQGYSKQTIGVYSSGAKFFLEWLIIEGHIEPPDFRQTLRFQLAYKTVMRKQEHKMPRFPKKGEIEKMLDAVLTMNTPPPVHERDIALIFLLYSTGCRNNEIVQLDVGDIDLKNQTTVVTGKGNKERRVFFHNDTAEYLATYWMTRHASNPNDPAFCRHDRGAGKKVLRLTSTTVRNIVNDVAKVAGIDPGLFSPHYFRHAFAIKMLQQTGNLALVQDLLGHASPNSTRVYAKIYPEELQKAHKEVFEV